MTKMAYSWCETFKLTEKKIEGIGKY